jgi:prepilin-type N-terminal cleavage/methylation domain-containing protein
MRPQSKPHRRPRTGFSLIELLVVVTIMGIVIATLVSVLGVGGGAARRGATVTTIEKVDSLLTAKVDALRKDFDEQERKKTRADVLSVVPGAPPVFAAETNWFNVLSNAEQLPTKYGATYAGTPLAARVVIVKMDRYRGMFPQRVRDLYGLNNTDDGAPAAYFDDSPLLKYWKSTSPPIWNGVPKNPSAHQPATESSELLYLTLSFGKASGASANVLDDINPRHLKDSDADGIPEIYDDWGNMLRFYNAPTRLVRPTGIDSIPTAEQYSVASTLISGLPARPVSASQATDFANSFNQDWLDSKKALQLVIGDASSRQASAINQIETLFYTPDTYWRPLIVSAGEDGDFGLGDPVSTGPERLAGPSMTDLTTAADNITNLQRLGGGK